MKIVTIIGARPQIIKAAALSREIKNNFSDKIEEVIVHTGQHYDENMSQVFFEEMQIPKPKYNLGVGSASHGKQTSEMIKGIEEILFNEKADAIVLFGDTNSTLAGAIAAIKIHTPIVHIEAGLRSFNKRMPEEINRIMCDHASSLLFSPTEAGIKNLTREGFKQDTPSPFSADNPGVFHCGDIMFDNSLYYAAIAEEKSDVLKKYNVPEKFLLGTIHRDANTDVPENLNSIFKALDYISKKKEICIVLPLHPRTVKLLPKSLSDDLLKAIESNSFIKFTPPVSFFDMIKLEKNAQMIVTDSGGVQKESYFFKKPCVILRDETEWIEIVEAGTGILTGADYTKIIDAYDKLSNEKQLAFPPIFGNGNAAKFICETMINNLSN